MPGLFQGISTMNGALRAFQRALNVTGNNISNVNTAGYSRQIAQFTEADPTTDGGVMIGNGVSASSIARIQDQFLFMRQIQASGENGRLSTLNSGLSTVQSVTNEPAGSGISDALNAFFNAWSALGSSPNDDALRQQVQQAGETLAGRVRGMYADLQNQATQTTNQISGTIQQAQSLANQIASMNKDVLRQGASAGAPNDLLDARDQAVQQLSQIMPVTVQQHTDGTISLYSGQLTLVDQGTPGTIPTTYDVASGSLIDGSLTYPVASGSLAGQFQLAQKIAGYQGQLDTLANTLRTQFNSIHATGMNQLGATNQNFFQDVAAGNPQTGAVDFQVDPAIVADTRAIATGVTGDAGDGGLALSMSALRDTAIAALGGKTFGAFYSGIVTGIGQDAADVQTQLDTSNSVMAQIGQQIQSVSGVSLDEEMSNMLRFQRSYQAAAKALSIFDQTTNDLINMIQ
ncbi:MAG TPA: flagellar hook-associated protein FlgK [Fimbriimonadaceae bacterium]|nr:flagellar hook-associated protein FlgK [Fimbriimonadaceae bacterium]